jgi:hypothetical protein
MPFKIDQVAREIALRQYVLPECLHVPTAALNEEAIATYIGDIVQVLAKGDPKKAFLVEVKAPLTIDARLPIWDLEGAETLHRQLQVWVHVGYTRYRSAYRRAFPSENIAGKVLSHALNRRVAALKGFQYVRITSGSRSANSSSAFSESWAVDLHGVATKTQEQRRRGAATPGRSDSICRSLRSDADDGYARRWRDHGCGK